VKSYRPDVQNGLGYVEAEMAPRDSERHAVGTIYKEFSNSLTQTMERERSNRGAFHFGDLLTIQSRFERDLLLSVRTHSEATVAYSAYNGLPDVLSKELRRLKSFLLAFASPDRFRGR